MTRQHTRNSLHVSSVIDDRIAMLTNERFEGTLQKWIEYPGRLRFGFAVMSDGKEVYVNEKDVRKTDLTRIDVGSRISFRLRPPKLEQKRFLDRLNAGFYRDTPCMNRRNPRPPLTETRGQRPQGINVRILTKTE